MRYFTTVLLVFATIALAGKESSTDDGLDGSHVHHGLAIPPEDPVQISEDTLNTLLGLSNMPKNDEPNKHVPARNRHAEESLGDHEDHHHHEHEPTDEEDEAEHHAEEFLHDGRLHHGQLDANSGQESAELEPDTSAKPSAEAYDGLAKAPESVDEVKDEDDDDDDGATSDEEAYALAREKQLEEQRRDYYRRMGYPVDGAPESGEEEVEEEEEVVPAPQQPAGTKQGSVGTPHKPAATGKTAKPSASQGQSTRQPGPQRKSPSRIRRRPNGNRRLITPAEDRQYKQARSIELAIGASVMTTAVPAAMLILFGKISLSQATLNRMLTFAAGAMLADVFLHLLPQAYSSGHSDSVISNLVLAGVLTFYAIGFFLPREAPLHNHTSHDPKNPDKRRGALRWDQRSLLNLIADASHNFTDGVVIGAAYLADPTSGWATAVAVFLHEIPHEIGDFAVLRQCGWTTAEIVIAQILTGIANLFGCVLVMLVGSAVSGLSELLAPLVAGSFLYIAIAIILGEIARNRQPTAQVVGHVIAFACGTFALTLVELVERLTSSGGEHGHSHGGHHHGLGHT